MVPMRSEWSGNHPAAHNCVIEEGVVALLGVDVTAVAQSHARRQTPAKKPESSHIERSQPYQLVYGCAYPTVLYKDRASSDHVVHHP